MAVTAHWIETTTIQTADGPQYILKLRADLIAFHHAPGRHSGEHLAEAFLQVLDRIGITSKVCYSSCLFDLAPYPIPRSVGSPWITRRTMTHSCRN